MCAVFVSSNRTEETLPVESERHGNAIRAWGNGTHGGTRSGTRGETERRRDDKRDGERGAGRSGNRIFE